MDEKPFLQTVFSLVEYLTMAELRTTSKKLIMNYMEESGEIYYRDKARAAIERYTQEEIPSLRDVQEKAWDDEGLNTLDHLILKMEYQARRLERWEDETN